METAKKYFKPEFLNRVDDVIIFRRLERADLLAIVDLEIRAVAERLKNRGITLAVDDEVRDFLITRGFEPEYGARPLRRAVERYLEDPLAEDLLKGYFANADHVTAKVDNQKLLFFPENSRASAGRRRSTRGGGKAAPAPEQ